MEALFWSTQASFQLLKYSCTSRSCGVSVCPDTNEPELKVQQFVFYRMESELKAIFHFHLYKCARLSLQGCLKSKSKLIQGADIHKG